MRVVLNETDLSHTISLVLLSDQSPADKLPLKWARELKVPFRLFRARSFHTTFKLAWMKRDVETFEIGQPDVVFAFQGTSARAGDRYYYALELAKRYGIPVRKWKSQQKYSKSLKETSDEES